MSHFLRSFAVMLGAKPARVTPQDYSPEAQKLYQIKRSPEGVAHRRKLIAEEKAMLHKSHTWRNRRFASIIIINLLFVVSFHFDIQLVEGAMTGSRVFGFHFIDLNAALQLMLAHKHIVRNLLIGTLTVFFLWWIVGGRSFCSWACPYHLVAELLEPLHLRLRAKGWAMDLTLHRGLRTVLFVIFLLLSYLTGYTVFETISPVGILSRAMIYGVGGALLWVGVILLCEVFLSRRAWCRYFCPMGLLYGFLGTISPLRVTYELGKCAHEGECRRVCLVPHVLEITKLGQARHASIDISADCTRCGLCIDACPTGALRFRIKGLDDIL